jgi:curved DNA-binding protein CbpA
MSKIERSRKLLSVSASADLKELKSAYRNLMKDFHPDKFQDNEEEKKAAEDKSKKIIDAYHFLVSIAPETAEANLAQYNATINDAGILDFNYKDKIEVLTIEFSDGATYEYHGVPKSAYKNLCNAPSVTRFARRHICNTYVYRSTSKLVAD